MINQHYHLTSDLNGFVRLRNNHNQIVYDLHSDEISRRLGRQDWSATWDYEEILQLMLDLIEAEYD